MSLSYRFQFRWPWFTSIPIFHPPVRGTFSVVGNAGYYGALSDAMQLLQPL